jgi:aldose 1-epimerase
MGSPSGEQVQLRLADQHAVVTEVGASLRLYDVAGQPVIAGYGEDKIASSGRGQVLAPWPNRLEDGSYELSGRKGTAALDEPPRRNAIHGLVRWQRFATVDRSEAAVTLSCDLVPQPGYPFALGLEIGYSLSEEGLSVTARATCKDDVPVPFGIGFHPYLWAGGETVSSALLELPADERLLLDDRALPIGSEQVAGTPYDFRQARPIGDLQLDDCFTALTGQEAVVGTPVNGRETFVRVDHSFAYLMCYTGDGRAVAIEPMSCAPNAFRNGLGLVMLEPGAQWSGGWALGVREA